MDVDDTDRRIVNALVEDGRASAQDLSKVTGISVPVVEHRLEALEREGVVGDYEPVVDYDGLGFDVTAILQVTARSGERESLTERLGQDPQLITVYQITGEYDVIAVGKYRNLSALNERVGDLMIAPSIRDVAITVVRETIKEARFRIELDGE